MNTVSKVFKKVRTDKPVVHHLTNWVTIYDCANITKVFGASPIMAHAEEEVEEMAKIASSLVLNIGTLTVGFVDSMKIAAKSANEKGIPVVLDVCGAGATKLRDQKVFELLDEVKINIIKGNASEIARIAGENVRTKGVDSTEVNKDLREIARSLAEERNCTVVITGREDIIADKEKTIVVSNGTDMMAMVVGTGCMAASVIGTFAAVEKDLAFAAASGLVCYEVAAELAAQYCEGPGSFKEKLFDQIHRLDWEAVEKLARVKIYSNDSKTISESDKPGYSSGKEL